MSTKKDKARRYAELALASFQGLSVIGTIAKRELGTTGSNALSALAAVAQVADRVKSAFRDPAVDGAKLQAELERLAAELKQTVADNDKTVDDALRDKFHGGGAAPEDKPTP